jgi:hypothetical protein
MTNSCCESTGDETAQVLEKGVRKRNAQNI